MTVEEGCSFAKDKKGNYSAQTGHDDLWMTVINISHYLNTIDYIEQIDELLDYVPIEFINIIEKKLNISLDSNDRYDDEDISDLL
jgi:hypothetical protein